MEKHGKIISAIGIFVFWKISEERFTADKCPQTADVNGSGAQHCPNDIFDMGKISMIVYVETRLFPFDS